MYVFIVILLCIFYVREQIYQRSVFDALGLVLVPEMSQEIYWI